MGREAGRPPGEQGVRLQVGGAGPHPSPHQSTVPGGHGKVCTSPETHSCGHSMSDCYQSGRASGRRAVLRAVISPKVRRPLTEQAPGGGPLDSQARKTGSCPQRERLARRSCAQCSFLGENTARVL